ncbi:hypothetical protein AMECASPLE_030484 [Ameca splendens]|uniref:Uncharacterized protein n=1 Tax=Ameca splendens TaxID=208324 RepID=A0ABV0ZS67_9TELE
MWWAYIQPTLSQHFVKLPFAASLLGYVSTSFAHVATYSDLDLGVDFDWAILTDKPALCKWRCIFRVIVLLDGRLPPQSLDSDSTLQDSHPPLPAFLTLIKRSMPTASFCHHQVSPLDGVISILFFPPQMTICILAKNV